MTSGVMYNTQPGRWGVQLGMQSGGPGPGAAGGARAGHGGCALWVQSNVCTFPAVGR